MLHLNFAKPLFYFSFHRGKETQNGRSTSKIWQPYGHPPILQHHDGHSPHLLILRNAVRRRRVPSCFDVQELHLRHGLQRDNHPHYPRDFRVQGV